MVTVEQALRELGMEGRRAIPVGNHEMDRHRVYRIEGPDGAVILKLYHNLRARAAVEVDAMEVVAGAGVPVARVLSVGTLSDGGEYMLQTLLPGRTLARTKCPPASLPAIYAGLGRMIGRLHTCRVMPCAGEAERMHARVAREWAALQALALDQDVLALFEAALARLTALAATLDMDAVPRVQCHYDFDERNVLVQGDAPTGLIDFEKARVENPVRDLAQLYAKTLFTPRNIALRSAFEAGYAQSRPLPEGFAERLDVYLIEYCFYVCPWAYAAAPDHYAQTFAFLKDFMARKRPRR